MGLVIIGTVFFSFFTNNFKFCPYSTTRDSSAGRAGDCSALRRYL